MVSELAATWAEVIASSATASPVTAPGARCVLFTASAARSAIDADGAVPFTVLSCDNLPDNGRLVRGVVLDMARARDTALADWPEVRVNADSAFYLKQGQAVLVPKAPTEGWVRIYQGDAFFAVGQVQDDGRIAPKRLMTGG